MPIGWPSSSAAQGQDPPGPKALPARVLTPCTPPGRTPQQAVVATLPQRPGVGDLGCYRLEGPRGCLGPHRGAGEQWAAVGGKGREPGRAPRPRMRATYTRKAGVRHLFAAYELGEDKTSDAI